MSKAKTAGGYDVFGRESSDACTKTREALAEKLADLVGPLLEDDNGCDVAIVVRNHAGVSVVGHANRKWAVLEEALKSRQALQ